MPIINKDFKNIKNIIIIIILFVLLCAFGYASYSNESFQTTTSSFLQQYITTLSRLINNPIYAIIDPSDKQGIYYNLNVKFIKKNNDLPIYTLYLDKPLDDDIKHYNNGDISQLERNRSDYYYYKLVINTRDTSSLYKFTKSNSVYYFNRVYLQPLYTSKCEGFFKESSCNKRFLGNKEYKSELVNITNEINNIYNIMITSNIFNIKDSIRGRYPLSITVLPTEILFKLSDALFNKTVLDDQIRQIKNTINDYKNLANIYLDSDYQGLFANIKLGFKMKSFSTSKIVYSIYIIPLINTDVYRIISKTELGFSGIIDNRTIPVDTYLNGIEQQEKFYTKVINASYTFYRKDNKYYFRRYLPYIEGKGRKRFDKQCDITTQINNLSTNFSTIFPPIDNTTAVMNVLDREIIYTININ